jgi:hypothetical protein
VKAKKKKTRFMKLVVAFVIASNSLFASAVLWVFYHAGTEPVTLIGFWFGFTTTELWALSGLKKKENDRETKGENLYEDR